VEHTCPHFDCSSQPKSIASNADEIARADLLRRVHRPGGDPRGEAGLEPGCDPAGVLRDVGHLLLHAACPTPKVKGRDYDFGDCGGSIDTNDFRALKTAFSPSHPSPNTMVKAHLELIFSVVFGKSVP